MLLGFFGFDGACGGLERMGLRLLGVARIGLLWSVVQRWQNVENGREKNTVKTW